MELDHLGIYRGLRRVLNRLRGGVHDDRRADRDRRGNCNELAFKTGHPATGGVFTEDLVSGRLPRTLPLLTIVLVLIDQIRFTDYGSSGVVIISSPYSLVYCSSEPLVCARSSFSDYLLNVGSMYV